MRLDGIGELIEKGPQWHLAYAACGHVQVLARLESDSTWTVAEHIRRHYAHCLTCRLEQRLQAPERAGRRRPPPGSTAMLMLGMETEAPEPGGS